MGSAEGSAGAVVVGGGGVEVDILEELWLGRLGEAGRLVAGWAVGLMGTGGCALR